ncbi:FadR/GntR family transcriptional regulator [Curtobacterium sp. L1-20]|uniref:FadR/GntR family transcriptional regulator n=1 Tax=Curtobacterium sp. L1-20 TaxID=3138181 RepID=UPI003B523127
MIYDRVLDELGRAVVDGTHPVGTARSTDDLVARTGASRSVVREAVRVLAGLGLVTARRRVGVRAAPPEEWDTTDPLVIGWRLAGPDRLRALDELRALRRAIEPQAAAAAAERASDATGRDGREALLAAADRLATAAGAGDAATFLQADRQVHRSVLALSGNAVFVRLGRVVARALDERADVPPDVHDVGLHVRLADAVVRGDADAAAATMTEIVDRAVA